VNLLPNLRPFSPGPRAARRHRGFTLLEVLVATAIMGIAVAGLMANLRTSLLNASKLGDYDRAAMLARRQMDELMLVRPLPKGMPIDGLFPPERMEGRRCGWRAVVTPFEGQGAPGAPPAPGTRILERIALQIWWMQGGQRRTLDIAAYRPAVATDADLQLFGTGMGMGAMR
jgi:general secretion pathway protein I